jgi:S1-C subfamily serine protease
LQEGDLIVEVAGRPIADFDALTEALEAQDQAAVDIRVLRGTEEHQLSVTFPQG